MKTFFEDGEFYFADEPDGVTVSNSVLFMIGFVIGIFILMGILFALCSAWCG